MLAFPWAGREGQRQKVTRATEGGGCCSGMGAVEHRVWAGFCHLISFRKVLFYSGFLQRCTRVMSVTKS